MLKDIDNLQKMSSRNSFWKLQVGPEYSGDPNSKRSNNGNVQITYY